MRDIYPDEQCEENNSKKVIHMTVINMVDLDLAGKRVLIRQDLDIVNAEKISL